MNKKTFLKPFRVFDLDFKRLKRWYLASLYSYDYTYNAIENIEYDNDKIYYGQYIIAHHKRELERKYKKNYVEFLEEMTLIRVISILEIFLLDFLRTIFYYDKSFYYSQNKVIEFHVSEFLSQSMSTLQEKFIDDKLGSLNRRGFNGINKFYSRKIKIEFSNFVSTIDEVEYKIKDIEKIHDMRHLLVHRLGKTDKKFKEDYGYKYNKILLSESEIIIYLSLINDFVEYIKNESLNKIFKN